MSHLEMQMHKYQDLTQTIDHFLNKLCTVNTSRLSPALVSPDVFYQLLTCIVTDIIRRNPDFIPVFTTLQNYYQQAMTSFTNTEIYCIYYSTKLLSTSYDFFHKH